MNKLLNNLGLTAGFCMVAIAVGIMLAPPQLFSQAVGLTNTSLVGLISNDPCNSPFISKYSTVVSITTATTTELTPLTAGKAVYSCSFKASVGAAQTVTFETGTKTTTGCDTGTSVKTGAFAITAASNPIEFLTPDVNTFQSVKAGEACLVTTTTGSLQGIFVYALM